MRTTLVAALAGLALATATPSAAQPGPPVFVLGDSLNDTGTFAPVTATGRFTTTPGLLWTEIVAASYGGAVAPAWFFDGGGFVANVGGTNYAQSGALVTGAQGLFDGVSKPVSWQVDRLLEARTGDLAGAVVLMDGGGPDLVLAAVLTQRGEIAPEQAVERVERAARDLAGQADRLSRAGADRLVLLGVADFGATPQFGAGRTEASGFLTALSRAFNAALAEEAARLGLDAVMPDLFAFFDGLIAAPGEHGFVNVTEPGVDPDRAPPTPTGNSANSNPYHLVRPDAAQTYLFADGLHPGARGHALLAAHVLAAMAAAR